MGYVSDCVKLAKETKINRYYCMTAMDANKLLDAYQYDQGRLVFESFKYGYAQGLKAQRAEDKKRDKGGMI